jgi:hypothetical protein
VTRADGRFRKRLFEAARAAEGVDQYLEVLKDAMGVQMYFPQQNAAYGLEVFRDIERRNR